MNTRTLNIPDGMREVTQDEWATFLVDYRTVQTEASTPDGASVMYSHITGDSPRNGEIIAAVQYHAGDKARRYYIPAKQVDTIDITPTWQQWATMYARMAESKEANVCRALRTDLMRMAGAADALQTLTKEKALTNEQLAFIAPILSK